MTDQWTEVDRDHFFDPGNPNGNGEEYSPPPSDDEYTTLFDAPDYATFIKHEQTARGKEYEQKVSSMLKVGILTAFRQGRPTDAATLLHYGPGFAKTVGDLTDVSSGAAKAIDILTAPDNPWIAFFAVASPLALQLFRNHEAQTAKVTQTWREARRERKRMKQEGLTPPPKSEGRPVTLGLPFGKKLTFRIHLPKPSILVDIFRAQTHDPDELTAKVLSDEKLRKALAKQGITITVRKRTNG